MSKFDLNLKRKQWKEQYKSNRHLIHISDEELVKRRRELLNNLLSFTEDGFPIFDTSVSNEKFVNNLFYIHEEMEWRGQNLASDPLSDLNIYRKKYPNIRNAIRAWGDRKLTMGQY